MNNNVDGSIIRIDEDTIYCELNTNPKNRFVNLPKTLFKEIKVRVGLPINLKVEDIGNPIITERKLKEQNCNFFDSFKF
jgi:hypothetical protein